MKKTHVKTVMSQVPLNALRAFDAVVRSGSFKAAAQTLCVTQSAVSHQVRHLEDWIGRPLFDRTGPRPRLLPEGEDLARVTALSLEGLAAACARLRREPGGKALVIAAIPSVALCWLIPRLAAFRAGHPDVEVRIVYAFHGQEIDFTDVDLAFVWAAGPFAPEPGVTAELFLPGKSVPVCSPALGAAGIAETTIGQLPLLHDTDETGWRTWFARAGVAMPRRWAGPVFQDFNLLRAAALAGQGVALCPRAMIRDDLESGRLRMLSEVSVMETSGYYLLGGTASLRRADAAGFRAWALAARETSAPG
jgi:LysR family glycine cleavage system transcriptional activator